MKESGNNKEEDAMKVKRKKYLVTGASSGIGEATSMELSIDSDIIILGRNKENLERVSNSLSQGNHSIVQADLMQIEEITQVIDNIYKEHTIIDGFVHCAGMGGYERLSKTTYAFVEARMKINVFAFLECIRCIMKKKKKEDPFSIVGLSSLASVTYEKYYTAYSASKGAVEALVRALSTELTQKNTRINAIRPAMVNTPMVADFISSVENWEQDLKDNGKQPLGIIPPEKVAEQIRFLLSDASRFTTGTIISLNAGAPC